MLFRGDDQKGSPFERQSLIYMYKVHKRNNKV